MPAAGRDVLPWLAIWAGALLVRAVYLAQITHSPLSHLLLGDAQAYDRWARDLAAGHWLGDQVFYQAPLYPYFLGVLYALGGHDLLWIRAVQITLGATSCVLLARAGRSFFGRTAGLVAGVLLALDPSAVYFDALVQKAVLDLFFFTVLLFALGHLSAHPLRLRWWLLAGGALGCLSLTRENTLLLIGVVLLWLWIYFRDRPAAERARWTAALGLGLALLLLPVALRNLAVGGELHLTTAQLGPNLYIGNNPDADGMYRPLRWGRSNALFEREDATELAEHALGRTLTSGEVSAYWTDRVLDWIRAHPADWLRLMVRKWGLVWNAVEVGDTEDQYSHADWSGLLYGLTLILHFGVICPLGVFGAWLTRRRYRTLWLLYLLVVTYAGSVALFFVFGRYRFPLVPLLILFAAAGLERGRGLLRERNTRELAGGAALGLLAAVGANWPLVTRDQVSSMTYYNLGGHMTEEGDTARALEFLTIALRKNPSFPQTYNQLGLLLFNQGRLAEAAQQLETAARLNPGYADAHHNLAGALLKLGRTDEAVAHYRTALEIDPGLTVAHHMLGTTLLGLGDESGAATEFATLLRLDPSHPNAHNNLGMALGDSGRLGEAIAQYREALRLTPDAADVHYNLGNALANQDQLDEARRELETSVRLEPTMFPAQRDLGQVLAAQGDATGAAVHLHTALRLAPPGSADARQVEELLRQLGPPG